MNITKRKQTHRYREQTSGYQWGVEEGQCKGRDMGGTDYWVKDKLQECIVQHGGI